MSGNEAESIIKSFTDLVNLGFGAAALFILLVFIVVIFLIARAITNSQAAQAAGSSSNIGSLATAISDLVQTLKEDNERQGKGLDRIGGGLDGLTTSIKAHQTGQAEINKQLASGIEAISSSFKSLAVSIGALEVNQVQMLESIANIQLELGALSTYLTLKKGDASPLPVTLANIQAVLDIISKTLKTQTSEIKEVNPDD